MVSKYPIYASLEFANLKTWNNSISPQIDNAAHTQKSMSPPVYKTKNKAVSKSIPLINLVKNDLKFFLLLSAAKSSLPKII